MARELSPKAAKLLVQMALRVPPMGAPAAARYGIPHLNARGDFVELHRVLRRQRRF